MLTGEATAALALVGAGLAGGLWLARAAREGTLAVARERAAGSILAGQAGAGSTPDGPRPLVSILVPARNEAARIGACLGSLLRQDYPTLEVIVVDDGSTDGTAEVARRVAAGDPRLRVMEAGPLPPGWGGKNHALWRGRDGARGAWLLFTDADTVHAPSTLGRAMARALAGGAGLLSLTGRQEAVSVTEQLVQPFVFEFLALRYPLAAVNDPADPRAAANGQFLLVERTVYDRLGGHEAVRGDLLEDVAIARLAKRAGVRVLFLAAPELLSVRMYDGARALWQGWTKNLADLAGGPWAGVAEGLRFLVRAAGAVVALLLAVLAAAWGKGALGLGLFLFGALGLAALHAEGRALARLSGRPAASAWLAPLGAAATGLLFLWSAWRRSGRRRVAWRGRRYPAGAQV